MNFTDTERNALLDCETEIKKYIQENHAKGVDFYHTMKQYIETHKLIKILDQRNNRTSQTLICYFRVKMNLLKEALASHDVVYESE